MLVKEGASHAAIYNEDRVCSEVVIDLPPELPLKVQVFFMWVVLYGWSSTASDC